MYKCAIFDLDGTLFNTLTTIAYYCNETLKKYGFEPIELEKFNHIVGHGAWDLINKIFALRDCTDEALIKEAFVYYNGMYDANVTYKTTVYDGIPELLSFLRDKGLKIGVLSNKPHFATNLICDELLGENFFDICNGQREGFPRKPDTTVLLSMMKEFGAAPEETLYLGDTSIDMQIGKKAGAFTVGVLWGFRDRKELAENNADMIISHPDEIKRLFD